MGLFVSSKKEKETWASIVLSGIKPGMQIDDALLEKVADIYINQHGILMEALWNGTIVFLIEAVIQLHGSVKSCFIWNKKQIVRDIFFLGQPSEPATKADIQVGKDLQDTLQANRERCVGMAANMIGVKKNIIIVNMGFIDVVMFNPVIVSKHDMYETEEGCLSLDGVRKTIRYQEIEVEYYDFNWKKQRQKLSGWTAQICQHEIDHLSGKII